MVHPAPEQWPPQRRIIDPEDAEARLKDFGMTVDVIRRAIQTGDTARQRVMPEVYPSIFPGVTMWAETLADWRRQLLKRRIKYEIGKTRNYETLYSVERGVAFAVVAGDSYTGIRGSRDPRLKRQKGIVTTQRVARNRRNSLLLGVQQALYPRPPEELPPDEACETWFLIVRPTKTEIRLELSRPIFMEAGIVSGYDERILLPPIPISGAIAPIAPDNGEDDNDDGVSLVGR